MNWIVLALLASVFWGLTYVIQEELFKNITVTTYLTFVSFFTFLIIGSIGIYKKTLISDLKNMCSSKDLLLWALFAIVIYILAELCIGYSIESKNATLAGLIEISYPLFIAFFALIIFKQNYFSTFTLIGAVLIISGVTLVSLSNK